MKPYQNNTYGNLAGETFKPVAPFPRGYGKRQRVMDFSRQYEVSNLGRVRRIDGWLILVQREDAAGNLVVDLQNGTDIAKSMQVKRLVAFTFLASIAIDWKTAKVYNKDGDKLNNVASNLTFIQPSKKRIANDMLKKGKKYGQIVEKTGLTIKTARQYGHLRKKKNG